MAIRIGELLIREKRINAEQLQEALNAQKSGGGRLGSHLVRLGYVKEEELTALLSKQYSVPSISLTAFEIDPLVVKLVPAETAEKYEVIPVSRSGATLTLAMADPTNVLAMDDIKFMTGYNVDPVVASTTAIADALRKYYGMPTNGGPPKGGALEAATRALQEMPAVDVDEVELLEDLEEISVEALAKQGEEAPNHPAGQRDADVGHPQRGERHSHRAV